MINFNVSAAEARLIQQIARRAVKLAAEAGRTIELCEISMDITATHANGCPLKLQELLQADESQFIHDVFGIRSRLDRETGKLTQSFDPRYAVA